MPRTKPTPSEPAASQSLETVVGSMEGSEILEMVYEEIARARKRQRQEESRREPSGKK